MIRKRNGVRGRRTGPGRMDFRSLWGRVPEEGLRLFGCVVGVVGTLVLYGVMQERLMSVPYKEDDGKEAEFFKYSLFLVLCNRLLTCSAAVFFLLVQKREMTPVAPVYKYGAVSLSNVIATTCQYEALKYVSFPVQTLAKSAKMIPVMIWGTAIMQKRYFWRDYMVAIFVTMGCTLFLLTGDNDTAARIDRQTTDNTFWGVMIMACYLCFDGFTSTFQDKLFKGYSMDIFNQILYVTLCSSVLSIVGLISSGHWSQALQFVVRHPQCISDIVFLSLAASTAQFFISFTIRTFGALTFAAVMTTRQLISIFMSCLWFAHALSPLQAFGTVVVFGALYYKSYGNLKKAPLALLETNARQEMTTKPLTMMTFDHDGDNNGGGDVEENKKRCKVHSVNGDRECDEQMQPIGIVSSSPV